jgi:hypothetical protein
LEEVAVVFCARVGTVTVTIPRTIDMVTHLPLRSNLVDMR